MSSSDPMSNQFTMSSTCPSLFNLALMISTVVHSMIHVKICKEVGSHNISFVKFVVNDDIDFYIFGNCDNNIIGHQGK